MLQLASSVSLLAVVEVPLSVLAHHGWTTVVYVPGADTCSFFLVTSVLHMHSCTCTQAHALKQYLSANVVQHNLT